MKDEDIAAAFAAFDDKHPFYLAVAALLDRAVESELDGVTAPNLADGARHFNAGRLAQARDFREYVHGTMQRAPVLLSKAAG